MVSEKGVNSGRGGPGGDPIQTYYLFLLLGGGGVVGGVCWVEGVGLREKSDVWMGQPTMVRRSGTEETETRKKNKAKT